MVFLSLVFDFTIIELLPRGKMPYLSECGYWCQGTLHNVDCHWQMQTWRCGLSWYIWNFCRAWRLHDVTWMRASSCARAQLQVGHLKPCDDKHALASARGKSCMGCAWSECSDNFQGSNQTLPKLRRVVWIWTQGSSWSESHAFLWFSGCVLQLQLDSGSHAQCHARDDFVKSSWVQGKLALLSWLWSVRPDVAREFRYGVSLHSGIGGTVKFHSSWGRASGPMGKMLQRSTLQTRRISAQMQKLSTQHSTSRNFVKTKAARRGVAFCGRYKLDDRTVTSMRPTTRSVAMHTDEILPVFLRPYVPPRDTSLPDLRAYRGGNCQMSWVVKLDFNRWSCNVLYLLYL